MTLSATYLLLPVAALLGAGCLGDTVVTGDPNSDMAYDPNADLTGVATSGPDMAVDPFVLFQSSVQGLLITDCGTCHAQAGGSYPGFLATTATSDVYTTFTHFPGLIGATPETSRILTKDVHVGPSFHATGTYMPPAQLAADAIVIADWIKIYNQHNTIAAASDMGVKKARITPFLPVMGTQKSIDLGELDSAYAGVTLTFTPTAIGTTSIQLKDITLKATATVGVKVTTPVFARYDAATPTIAIDIDYDYLNKDIAAYPGGTTVFGPSLTIFAYTTGQLIDVSFDKLAPATGAAPDMGTGATVCKNVAGFTTFKAQLTGGAGINCANCHNAGVGGFNTNGIANNASDATTCPAVLVNTVPATPGNSAIYLHVTDASNHAGGKLAAGAATAYLAALTTWLNTEK